MGVSVVTPYTVRGLTSTAAVLAEVPTAGTSAAGTALVNTLIVQASDAIASYCNRVWGRETVLETLPGSGTRFLGLTRVPLVSVGTVVADGGTVDTTDYSIEDADAGSLYREDGWPGGAGGGWDSIAYSSGYISPWTAPLRYEATYIGGYTLPGTAGTATYTLPGDVERACIETVKAWWQARASHDPSVAREQAGDVSVSYAAPQSMSTLPAVAAQLLAPWRRPAFRY